MIGEELPSSSSPADAATEDIGRMARMVLNDDGNMNEFVVEAMNKRLASVLIVANDTRPYSNVNESLLYDKLTIFLLTLSSSSLSLLTPCPTPSVIAA
jgi:hypothetical protein